MSFFGRSKAIRMKLASYGDDRLDASVCKHIARRMLPYFKLCSDHVLLLPDLPSCTIEDLLRRAAHELERNGRSGKEREETRHALTAVGVGRGDRCGRNAGNRGYGERDRTYTYCAHHGERQGYNTPECIVIRREFDRYYGDFHEYLLTWGLGPYAGHGGGLRAEGKYRQQTYPNDLRVGVGATRRSSRERRRQDTELGLAGMQTPSPEDVGHENWHHPSGGRGRGRGEGFGLVPPPNFSSNSPPIFSPNLPPGKFLNAPRHAFAADYPYENEYMGYSGWGAAAGHWSPPPTAESGTPEQQQQLQQQQEGTPPATSTSATATLSSPASGAAQASGAPLQLFIARSVEIGGKAPLHSGIGERLPLHHPTQRYMGATATIGGGGFSTAPSAPAPPTPPGVSFEIASTPPAAAGPPPAHSPSAHTSPPPGPTGMPPIAAGPPPAHSPSAHTSPPPGPTAMPPTAAGPPPAHSPSAHTSLPPGPTATPPAAAGPPPAHSPSGHTSPPTGPSGMPPAAAGPPPAHSPSAHTTRSNPPATAVTPPAAAIWPPPPLQLSSPPSAHSPSAHISPPPGPAAMPPAAAGPPPAHSPSALTPAAACSPMPE